MISVDQLTQAIVGQLEEYNQAVTKAMKQTIAKTANDMNHVIKQNIPFRERTGDYVRSFAVKTTYEDETTIEKTWHVKKPNYRIAHLLEHGHYIVKRGKQVSKVKAYPHIQTGREWAERELPERIKERVNGL